MRVGSPPNGVVATGQWEQETGHLVQAWFQLFAEPLFTYGGFFSRNQLARYARRIRTSIQTRSLTYLAAITAASVATWSLGGA